jgi:hypothetical protein
MRLGVTVVCREAPGPPSPLARAAGPGPSPSPLVPTLARNGPGPGARKRRPGRQRYPFIPTDSDSLRLGQIPTESESRAALWSGLGEREERLREARESERERASRAGLYAGLPVIKLSQFLGGWRHSQCSSESATTTLWFSHPPLFPNKASP